MKGTGKSMCRAQPVMWRKTAACGHKRRSAAEEIPAAATAAPAADIAHQQVQPGLQAKVALLHPGTGLAVALLIGSIAPARVLQPVQQALVFEVVGFHIHGG